MFAIVLLMLIVILILSIIFIKIDKNTKSYPPGPFSWPFIGNQILLKRLTRDYGGQHKAFMELSKRYNSDIITVNISHEKIIIVSGSKFCDMILQNEEFQGRPWNEFIKIRNMGKKQGITMNDGPEWKELRNWMMRTMRIFGFGKSEMIKMIQNQLVIFSENLNKNKLHQLKLLFVPAVINVLWNFTTGELIAFNQQQKLEYFLDLLERRSRCFDITGGLLAAFPWIRYIAPEISGYNIMCMLNKELKDFLMKIINDHKEKYNLGKEADLIDMFLQEMKKNEESTIFTEEQLMMILVDLFLAGFTTTSTSLDFLFLIMTLFPDVQRKVQKEIDSVIPHDRLPNMEDKAKLPYVEAVISETYRLWPVFPIIGPRRVLCDTNIGKYMIPKNTTVLFNTYSINKDPTLYSEPDKFMPERFIKNGVFEPDEYSLQFGKGKRRCPGDVLAKATIFILFVGIMQKYTLLPVPGKGPYSVEINSGITLTPQSYNVLVEKRI